MDSDNTPNCPIVPVRRAGLSSDKSPIESVATIVYLSKGRIMMMTEPRMAYRAHQTPEPDIPPDPKPALPDDVPSPANAPVEEPRLPEPPIRAV